MIKISRLSVARVLAHDMASEVDIILHHFYRVGMESSRLWIGGVAVCDKGTGTR